MRARDKASIVDFADHIFDMSLQSPKSSGSTNRSPFASEVRNPLLIAWIVKAFVVTSFAGCGGSPMTPSASQNSSAPIHDTLNVVGSAAAADAVWSELSGGFDRQVYDDFVSPTAVSIRTVAWQGVRRPATQPPARFYLAFFADSGGAPLRQYDPNTDRLRALSAATYSIDQVNERLRVTRACDNSSQEQCGSYDYSVALTVPFATTAGTRYWLLIQAESPLESLSGWSWRKGQTDNGFSLSNIANTTFPWDLAFALRP